MALVALALVVFGAYDSYPMDATAQEVVRLKFLVYLLAYVLVK